MITAGSDEKIYPVVKIATIVDALAAEGVSPVDALRGVELSQNEISSPATLVSLNQVIECYRNAAKLSRDPHFGFRAGLKFHVSTYGMYGFAILSSTNFRRTMRFAMDYHQLATPLTNISFQEESRYAAWTISPIPHPWIDAPLYKFLVEHQFGVIISLLRDVMGLAFAAQEFHVTYNPSDDATAYSTVFEGEVLFGRPQNKLVFDTAWLDSAPKLGNEITYSAILKLCDELIEELQLRIGVIGKVREILLGDLTSPPSLDSVADRLHMTQRTLRRKLREEHTSFRKVVDELRMFVAVKYLRDTKLTTEDIAYALGFSDAANFRHAFRRWTKCAPVDFRDSSKGLRKAGSSILLAKKS
jgi:AraC-like DNA-binding protein